MAKISKEEWVGCPFRFAAATFGDKWSILILRDLFIHSYARFSEFQNSPEGIATNVLSNRLESYVDRGILTKEKDPVDARQSIYKLTRKGKALTPIIIEIIKWAKDWDENTLVPEDFMIDMLANAGSEKRCSNHE